jgi:hypothetical protein
MHEIRRSSADLVAMLALVALCHRLGVEPQAGEAGLPLRILAIHHQFLHAVDELEVHVLQQTTSQRRGNTSRYI